MRLVIDCFKLVKGKGKSIGIYNLAQNLARHLTETNRNGEHCEEIIVLGNEYNRKDFDIPGIRFIPMKGNPLNELSCIIWELFRAPLKAKKYKADRILFPRGYRPLFYRGKDTVIIHDLIPFFYDKHFPGVLNRVENAYIMSRLKASMKHADRIITISEFSRKEIDSMYPGSAERTRVIYNGLTEVKCSREKNALIPEEPYLYATASGLPHKNAAGVLKTYDVYYHQAENPVRLVVVGIPGTDSYEISKEAAEHVTCYKYIERSEDMHSLLAGARAFLFLSLIEGFGFPPLEAMQLGVPVVCSNRTALPEVVGDAGLLTDPDQYEQTVDCLNRILSEEALRKTLIEKGYENVKRFGWDSRIKAYWEELTR